MDALLQCNTPIARTGLEQHPCHIDDVTRHLGHRLATLHRQLAHGVVSRIFIKATGFHQDALGFVDQLAVRKLL